MAFITLQENNGAIRKIEFEQVRDCVEYFNNYNGKDLHQFKIVSHINDDIHAIKELTLHNKVA